MGDLKSGETFEDRVYITDSDGVAAAGLTTTCKFYDEEGNETNGTTAELGNGLYHCTDFAPDADGTWNTIWGVTDEGTYVIYHMAKIYKVGGGTIDDVETDVATVTAALAVVDGYHDVPGEDAAADATIRDVVGKKTDTVAGTSIVAIAKQIKAETASILTDTSTTLDDLVDDLEARLTAARAGYMDKLANHLVTYTWFSSPQEAVIVTGAAGDKVMPSVVLPNIAGTIVHAYAGWFFRMVENTYAGVNKLDGAQEIQVKENAAGGYIDAINMVDDLFTLADSAHEGGIPLFGHIDVIAEVAAFNKTYDFQWDEAVADQNNLEFNDLQTFLTVRYY